ncbi:hypothetical protein K2Z84_08735 [Candidatus Binatia bacterium]|nr:hypothetical protein [Candidatus Binatia bacterium]
MLSYVAFYLDVAIELRPLDRGCYLPGAARADLSLQRWRGVGPRSASGQPQPGSSPSSRA